ncbi:phosphoglucomutase [Angomonas deanei]|nr:phosphoglucomutase [Angomonas deanei]|eukprot:EPY40526.1 phosphoglucomutase [Angomonas deanei]
MSVDVPTKPYTDQKPGTSGLRKKVTVFQQENYTANFAQSTFNAIRQHGEVPEVLLVGGDGRYYLQEAIQIILQVAAGNGVKTVWVGQNGLLSTPAVSVIVRRREGGFKATGSFILTASHNPGGPDADFGMKYNTENGGPAPEKITDAIFEESRKVEVLRMRTDLPSVDLSTVGKQTFGDFTVEVIDSLEDYTTYMKSIFDFDALQKFTSRPDVSFHLDCLHGASGPYVKKIFHEVLGVPTDGLHNFDPLPDFGGGHPDPNLTYAHDLVQAMGLLPDGAIAPGAEERSDIPTFGAAFDGDADRNMVLGTRFFVNPSDSLAVLAANADAVPFFVKAGGLKSVARSMPTSGAVDRVAEEKKLHFFEVPTGWKYFGNLMDSKDVFKGEDFNPLICGEESFGTGSNHIREKDGVWAALFWLSVLAARNADPSKPLVTVQQVVEDHWKHYGRNYYSRYDYENVSSESANEVMKKVAETKTEEVPLLSGKKCVRIDNFEYTDPVDHFVSKNQGMRVIFEDNSRFVIRLSGTGSSGATIRLYLEQYMPATTVEEKVKEGALPTAAAALKELIEIALKVTQIPDLTGRDAPTVIT